MMDIQNLKAGIWAEKRESGFTFLELMIAMVIICVLTAVAIPAFSGWLPGHRLKSAALDLYSNMQLAKMASIKANADWAIVFDKASNSYAICSDDGGDGSWTDGGESIEITVSLADYESGIAYGHGVAGSPIDTPFGDEITYESNVVVFNPRGTALTGYVYLENDDDTITYGVGTRSTGIIRLLKWNSSIADWE